MNNNVKTFQHFKTEYLKELSSNDVKEYINMYELTLETLLQKLAERGIDITKLKITEDNET